MADKRLAETLLEIDGIETCYGQSQVLFGMALKIDAGAPKPTFFKVM